MSLRGLSDAAGLENLGIEDCWRLLAEQSVGRICFAVEDRVQVLLSAYVVHLDRVYFRAAAFGTVARRVLTRPVTLEVDDLPTSPDAGSETGSTVTWAVTVTGDAQLVEDPATLASLWTPVRPTPWETGHKTLWVELTPDDVRGRRVRA